MEIVTFDALSACTQDQAFASSSKTYGAAKAALAECTTFINLGESSHFFAGLPGFEAKVGDLEMMTPEY